MNKKYSDEWFNKANKDFKTVIENYLSSDRLL